MNELFRFLNEWMNTRSWHLTGALVEKEAAIAVSFYYVIIHSLVFNFKE